MLGKSPPLRPTATAVVAGLTAALAPASTTSGSFRLRERSERVLPRPAFADAPDDVDTLPLAVDGDLDGELRVELAAAGIRVVEAGNSRALAVFAPGADLPRLQALVAGPLPVITDVAAGDFDALAARVRVGCKDALPRPVRADALARKLRRLATSSRRLTPVGAGPR